MMAMCMSMTKIRGCIRVAEEKYVLTLTREQAQVAQNALELYARLKIGQFDRITELMLDVRSVDEYCQRRDLANDLLKIVACIIFGRNDYGQPKCEKDALHHRAWNIYTALRYQMAWHDHPEGGWGLHFDKPYPWGGEPVAECRIEEGQSLVDVRKHGEEELSEMEQSNGCN